MTRDIVGRANHVGQLGEPTPIDQLSTRALHGSDGVTRARPL